MIDLVHRDISVYCFLLSFEAEAFYLQNEMKLVCTFDINTFKFQRTKNNMDHNQSGAVGPFRK